MYNAPESTYAAKIGRNMKKKILRPDSARAKLRVTMHSFGCFAYLQAHTVSYYYYSADQLARQELSKLGLASVC